MAKFTNELDIDVSQFISGLKQAEKAAAGLADDVTIGVNVDTSEIKTAQKAVDKLDGQSATVALDVDVSAAESKAEGFIGGLKKQFGELADQAKGGDLAGAFGGISASIGAALPGLAAAGAAIGAVGAALGDTIAKGREFNEAMRNVGLQTGLAGEELEGLGEAARNAFVRGVGESAAEAVKTLGSLKQTLGSAISTDALDDAAIRANQVAKSLGVETPELVAKISPLIKQYGLTFDEALNQVAAGAQKGVADVGGYLDAISEFTVNAKEAGFSAEEFGASLQVAAQSGVKDLAKVGDGIKEIENRIKSGDLGAQFAAVSGQIGKDLQGIAQQGRDGVLSGKDVLQQSVDSIQKAFQGGEISKAFRDQLLVSVGGSIAEDVGSDVFANMFAAENLDVAGLKKSAEAAGKTINDNIPPPSIGAIFENIQTEIGAFFDNIYKQVIGPFITPLIEAFERIKESLSDVFGEGIAGGAEVLKGIIDGLVGTFEIFLDVLIGVIDIFLVPFKAIIQTLKDAVGPIIDEFSGLFDSVGEGVDVFETVRGVIQTVVDVFSKGLYNVLRFLQKPLVFLGKAIAFIVGTIKDVIVAVADWVMGLEFVQDAIAVVRDAIDAFVSKITAIGDAVGGFLKSIGFIEDEAPKAADAIAEVGDAADEANDEILKLAQGVNELAQGFNNALAAAQANLANLQAAGAVTGGYRKEIAKAAAELRKLEKAQDDAALAGDPARRLALTEQIRAAVAETKKLGEDLTIGLITNANERNKALLDAQQKYDNEQLEAQIKQQKKIIAIGGAGIPEAKAALEALNEQRKRLTLQQQRDTLLLEAQFQQERLAQLQAKEQLIVDALGGINERVIAQAQKQLDAANLTQGNIDRLVNANVDAIKRGAEQEAKALIESLPEFQKARAEIDQALSVGAIDADAASAQIKELLATYRKELEASTGDDPIAENFRNIFRNAEDAAVASAKVIRQQAEDVALSLTSSEILRGIDEQVLALQRQRDLLLQNVALTEDQRAEIEKGYATAIDKVRRGPIVGLRESIVGISEAIQNVQFDLNADGAEQDAEDIQKQIDAINEALRAGEISYQEALEQLSALEQGTVDFASTLGSALGQALAQTSDAIQASVQESIAALNTLREEQRKVALDTTKTEEERAKEVARLGELIATQQGEALEQIGAQAGTQLAALIAQGADVGEALKTIAGDTVKSLLALYTPSILALFQSIIPPPFGLIAGSAAVAALQALVASALSGFEEGGFTGGSSTKEVRGVVHGKEFVANAGLTKREGDLFKFLHAGGTSQEYFAKFMSPQTTKTKTLAVDTTGALVGIMSDVRDQLSRIPSEAMMKHSVDMNVGFDAYLYQKNMRRNAVRRLR